MRNICRLIILGLVQVLALVLFVPFPAVAASDTIVTISAPSRVVQGEQFDITIEITPGTEIAGIQLNLGFASSVAVVSDVAEGNLLSQNGSATYFNPGITDNLSGIVTGITGVITSPGRYVSTSGTFATVTLEAAQSGTSALTVSNVLVGDINGQAVSVTVENSQVTVSGAGSGGGVGGSSGGGGGGGGGIYMPPPDTTPPFLYAIGFSEITQNSAEIRWSTDEESSSRVELLPDGQHFSPADDTPVKGHSVLLTGLESNTAYSYKVISVDEAGNTASSGVFEFTTLPAPANIVINALDISPDTALVGEEITITVSVVNTGDLPESNYKISLMIDGVAGVSRVISMLDGGSEVKIPISIRMDDAGNYDIDVNGAEALLIVREEQQIGEAGVNNDPEASWTETTDPATSPDAGDTSAVKINPAPAPEPAEKSDSFITPRMMIIASAAALALVVAAFLFIRHHRMARF